ncbi:hypothetical protein AMJ80_11545 [bacterium SM23_31]|nr:MAG: hypothetical protein AMJ80_11545 [bacterium SM23_31]
MIKKMIAVPVIIVLAVVISFSGTLLAQDIEKAKADYDRLVKEINEIFKKMEALKAGQEEEYKKLEALYNEKNAELDAVTKILQGNEEMQRKIGEVVRLYEQGKKGYNAQSYIYALSQFNEAIAKGEVLDNPLVDKVLKLCYAGIASVFYSQRKFTEMIEPLQQAIKIDPEYYGAYNMMGMSYTNQGKFDSAVASYMKSIEINDTAVNYTAHYNLGTVYFNMKNFNKAKNEFLIAVDRNPQNYKSFTYLGKAYLELKDYPNARAALERSVLLNNTNFEHYYYLSQVYNKIGEYNKAIEAANNSMKYDAQKKTFGGALIERGNAHEYLNKNALAIRDYQEAAKYSVYKESAEYYILLLEKHGGIKARIDTSLYSTQNNALTDAKIYLKLYKK